jgi:mono/diheme cytochrome c family protein
MARGMALPRDAKAKRNPVPNSPDVLKDAREHWADHCAVCHANDGSGEIALGRQMYPPAPDMRKERTQRMSDGELFYIIENGIRLTGMPAWGTGKEADVQGTWKLVHFIRHLPNLTPEEIKEMEKLNPKSAADLEEEKQEEEFLKGKTPSAAPKEHHHH